MNRDEFLKLLKENGITEKVMFDNGFFEEGYCIRKKHFGWEVFYLERGQEFNVVGYPSESNALIGLYEYLLKYYGYNGVVDEGCSEEYIGYKFLHDTSEIISVKIVELQGFDNMQRCFNERLIREIDDVESIVDELRNFKCRKHYCGLSFQNGDKVIKITYINSDYELIRQNSQRQKKNDFPVISGGNQELDKEQFEQLISRYISSGSYNID